MKLQPKRIFGLILLPAAAVFVAAFLGTGALAAPGGAGTSLALSSINDADFRGHIYFLASDELEGRAAGSAGANVAAEYIASEFHRCGIQPAGDAGTFFQKFTHNDLAMKNVAGILPGTDPDLKREIVVLGAHYDHVGLGKFGSTGGPDARGKIHNGADDNASGTSAVLEMAEAFAMAPPQRTMLFLLFTGEEMGLIGSKYYVDHPLLPLADTVAMINLDMVGRSKDDYLFIGGTGTSPVFRPLIDGLNKEFAFKLETNEGGRAPSDNASFYSKDIPVLFFFTNVHEDYHNPGDDWDKVNYEGARNITRFAFRTADSLANAPARPAFTKSDGYALPESMRRSMGSSRSFASRSSSQPFLGVQFGSSEPGVTGVPIESVVEGSPADKAGMLAGDRILAIDDAPMPDSAALLKLIASKKVGDTIRVRVQRASVEKSKEKEESPREIVLEAVLGKRSSS